MNSNSPVLKSTARIAIGALGVLFIMAIVFFQERVFFADASYILFSIIDQKALYIQEHRYGSFITQLFPYLGEKLHLPLKTIIVGYAISFNLFYLTVGCILYRCRQYALTVVMALYFFLIVSASYFWTNNEIHQAVAWMFLLFGITVYLGQKKANIIVTLLVFSMLAFLTIFTHFVVIIPLVFIWIYLIAEKENWPFTKMGTALLSGIIVLMMVSKFAITRSNAGSYDSTHLHGVTHFSIKDIIQSFYAPVVHMFLIRCVTNYWAAVLVFTTGIVSLALNKKWLLAGWSFISVVGYFIVMGLTYATDPADTLLFHIESEWACIGILAAVAFTYSFLPRLKPVVACMVLLVLFAIRFGYIYAASDAFTGRHKVNKQVLDQMRKKGITKLGLVNHPQLMSLNMLYWALPYESLMMSAIAGDNPQLTFFFVNNDENTVKSLTQNAAGFANTYGTTPPGLLHPRYIKIDTTHNYRVMTYEELMK